MQVGRTPARARGSLAQAKAPVVTKSTAWLDHPALQPGGALAAEKRGVLGPFDVVPGRLVAGSSGVHHFVLSGRPGVTLQAKVATDRFEPVVAVIAPSGLRWDVSHRARAPDGGAGATSSPEDLVLPETGDYVLVVTARENLAVARAVTTGEYRLTLLCDAPRKPSLAPGPRPPTNPPPAPAPSPIVAAAAVPAVPKSTPSSRSGRFAAWESEPG